MENRPFDFDSFLKFAAFAAHQNAANLISRVFWY